MTRLLVLASVTSAAVLSMAVSPAGAHVEVESRAAVAGRPATLDFVAESESRTAGIVSLNVKLPSGIAPGDVRLREAPRGWTFAATSVGYIVSGPEVTAGVDAEYSVSVAALPAQRRLAFPTVQGYSDGHKDAWVERPAPGTTQEPEMPAPVLEVSVPAGSTAAASPTGSMTPATPSAVPSTSVPAAAAPATDDGGSVWPVIVIVVVAVAVVGIIGLVILRRRQRRA